MSLYELLWGRIRERITIEKRCWIWQGATTPDGYGKIGYKGKFYYVHIVAFVVSNGPVPRGKEIHHKCERKNCVRPRDLKALTHRANCLASDTPARRNHRKTRCKRRHPLHGKNLRVYKGKRYCRACKRILNKRYV